MWDKSKAIRIPGQPSLVQMTDNVEYFNCLGSMITNDARCTGAIIPSLLW